MTRREYLNEHGWEHLPPLGYEEMVEGWDCDSYGEEDEPYDYL